MKFVKYVTSVHLKCIKIPVGVREGINLFFYFFFRDIRSKRFYLIMHHNIVSCCIMFSNNGDYAPFYNILEDTVKKLKSFFSTIYHYITTI